MCPVLARAGDRVSQKGQPFQTSSTQEVTEPELIEVLRDKRCGWVERRR